MKSQTDKNVWVALMPMKGDPLTGYAPCLPDEASCFELREHYSGDVLGRSPSRGQAVQLAKTFGWNVKR